ncbi:MAG: thiamine pyrophosphate-binding protein [Rhodocyclaceae bacterium]|nr:thiamine pyrophosphate-binding protein [Rhodocyclaceae bacterium]
MTTNRETSGGALLVRQLEMLGAEVAFGVPGESYLPVLDAFLDGPIRFVACRQEGGAAMMAEAWGKLTGAAGLCFVTRGPGATNASAGVHVARQDSTPMLLFVGDVARGHRGREAFQEVDLVAMFSPLAKAAMRIDAAARIPELVFRAHRLAMSGRPGPVVVVLPEDVLGERTDAAPLPPVPPADAWPSPAQVAALADRLAAAERPFLLVGGPGWTAEACAGLAGLAERWQVPVGVSFRCQDLIDNDHPCYAGHVGIGIDPALATRIRDADLLIVLGARLGEMTTGGYRLPQAPRPRQQLVHVHPDPDEPGHAYRPDLAITAGMAAAVAAFAEIPPPSRGGVGVADTEASHAAWQRFATPIDMPGEVPLGAMVRALETHLGAGGIVTNGAGNFSIWLHRHYRWHRRGTQLAPTSGSMGYGLPAAVAAALAYPGRDVACWSGDGCFLMHGQELATAVALGLKLLIVVVDNSQYGTIRMHQERRYPGRVSGTALVSPDFVALARAYGADGEAADDLAGFEAALARAAATEGPYLIHVRLPGTRLTPGLTLADLQGRQPG